MPESKSESPIVIAVPKGRVLEQLSERLERAGISTKALTAKSRKLVREDKDSGLRFLLLKPDDVPTYVEYGTADLGVVGRDVLMERAYDVLAPVDLGIGKCKMMVCGLPGETMDPPGQRPLRVATKFMHIAEQYFRSKGIAVELIFVQGSVELAPLTGLADVIVDLVETGETLRQNGLVTLEPIADVSSVLIANRVGLKLRRARIEPVLRALRSS
jgi:ATP phosphoribosyltransferase